MNNRKVLALDLGTQTGCEKTTEEWKVIRICQNYEISSRGKVRRVSSSHGSVVGRILKPWISVGYFYVGLWEGNKQIRVAVHRLIADAFLPNPEHGQYHVAHNNGNRLDNRIENLRWATPLENHADRLIHGTNNGGEGNPMSRLTCESVSRIKAMRNTGIKQREVAAMFGICRQTVSDIWIGRRWADQ